MLQGFRKTPENLGAIFVNSIIIMLVVTLVVLGLVVVAGLVLIALLTAALWLKPNIGKAMMGKSKFTDAAQRWRMVKAPQLWN